MMEAFVTGSHAYGRPNENSDVDLVVLVTPRDMAILENMADVDEALKRHDDYAPNTVAVSLRFGNLNLICTYDPVVYAVWLKGTKHLRRAYDANPDQPFSHDFAKAFFTALRKQHGTNGDPDAEMATIDDIRRKLAEPVEDAPF